MNFIFRGFVGRTLTTMPPHPKWKKLAMPKVWKESQDKRDIAQEWRNLHVAAKRRKEEGPAVGIDLGTTYSCVAVWSDEINRAEIIHNDQGKKTTPSFVAFTSDQRLIGEAAKNQAATNPTNTVFGNLLFFFFIFCVSAQFSCEMKTTFIDAGVKKLIGRKYSESAIQNDMKLWPFKVVAGKDDKPEILVEYKGEEKRLCAEEI